MTKLIPRSKIQQKMNKFLEGGSSKKKNYKKTVNPKWESDKNWKYYFLDSNRNAIDLVLSSVAHKRGLLNVLLTEGYVTNMLNLNLSVDPDSSVVARNPSKNPGLEYDKLGNYGLDNLETEYNGVPLYKLLGYNLKLLSKKRPFDNKLTLLGKDNMSLIEAAKAINLKLNNGKKELYDRYSKPVVDLFFRKHPEAEDRMLYSYYKMDQKFVNRLKSNETIDSFYNQYILGGLNGAYKSSDYNRDIINAYFKNLY